MKSTIFSAGWVLSAILGLFSVALSPFPVKAQSGASSQALQQKLEQAVAGNERNLQALAKAMNEMSQLKQDVQAVKGQVDASKFLTQENEKVYQDLDMRVSALEDKIGQIHTLLKEMRVAGDASAAPTTAKASKEYEEFQGLLNLVNAQDYRSAASGFLGFMKKYPQSPSAGSAQFWAAESFFSMGDNARAISEFQNLTEKFPQHPRVKEAVLKQGIAFQKMKKYQEATLFYQKVIGAYPRSAEALQAQGRLSRLQALEGGKSLALQMSATPGPTPSPKPSTGTPRYDQPVMKPIPHPGANPPPTAPKPANTPPVPAVPQTQEKSEAPLF